ncbi:MAG: hypothetical protein MUO52_14085 [Desulfobacterales bacterium]|nr:hypothetical protein [Desulfobacterales bacterium]
MGISTKLDPVLSFPLGANSVSILEAALAYQTIMTGKTYPLEDGLETDMVPIIAKIVDRQGKTIWEYESRSKKILSERTSALVCDILRLVVENGTGKGAKEAIQLTMDVENEKAGLPIPSFGKTGTANRFTNSSFVGFIPGPVGKSPQLGLEQGYVIASYVGYDDNRPMKGKQVVIYGASGALPLWVDVGNTIVNSVDYRKDLEVADLAFNLQSAQMVIAKGLRPVPVSSTTGLPVGQDDEKAASYLPRVLVDGEPKGDTLNLRRVFEPYAGDYHEEK